MIHTALTMKYLDEHLYYQHEDFSLYQGDAVALLKFMPAESIDMIFADPPYLLSNGGITCQSGTMVSVNKGDWDKSKGIENDFEFHKTWLLECQRVLKPNGTIWISGTYHSIYACGFALQNLGFHLLNDITWFKPNAAPNLSCRFFTASHETLLWAKKHKQARHTFHYDAMKHGDWSADVLKKPDKQMRSVWSIPPPAPAEKVHGKHPTQKPLSLMTRILMAASNQEDLILDPFSGSATTGIAAAQLGRKYIGIEIDENFLELSVRRFKDLIPGKQAQNLQY